MVYMHRKFWIKIISYSFTFFIFPKDLWILNKPQVSDCIQQNLNSKLKYFVSVIKNLQKYTQQNWLSYPSQPDMQKKPPSTLSTSNPQQIYQSYKRIENQSDYTYIKKAVQLIKSILSQNKLEGVYVSFNGGKDATVVLFLTFLAVKELGAHHQIQCIEFKEPNPFEEVQQFISLMQKSLNLIIHRLPTKKYPSELTTFCKTHPVTHIIMGSRVTDPYCSHLKQRTRSDTDKGYPPFERVNPIIFWDCQQVWKFLKVLEVPYCKLYDDGYTSLGNKSNTVRNQNLKVQNARDGQKYLPAFFAKDEDERKNRDIPGSL